MIGCGWEPVGLIYHDVKVGNWRDGKELTKWRTKNKKKKRRKKKTRNPSLLPFM